MQGTWSREFKSGLALIYMTPREVPLFLSLLEQRCIIGNSEFITQSSKSTPTYAKTIEIRKRDWAQLENSR